MIQKLLVVIALCFATNLGVISAASAEPLKVRFSTQCDSDRGMAVVQYETGYKNGGPANIGFSFIASGATANAELAGFPEESFRDVTATVTASAGLVSLVGLPFSVTVTSIEPDGVEYRGTAVVAIPLSTSILVRSAQFPPPGLPQGSRLKDITFSWKIEQIPPGLPPARLTITNIDINGSLVSFSMEAQLSSCP